MARLERVAFHLKLIPLLFRRVEVGHVELIGLDLLLETSEDGIRNWDFRRERAAAADSNEAAPAPEAGAREEVVPAEVVAATEAETGVALTALIRNVRARLALEREADARVVDPARAPPVAGPPPVALAHPLGLESWPAGALGCGPAKSREWAP